MTLFIASFHMVVVAAAVAMPVAMEVAVVMVVVIVVVVEVLMVAWYWMVHSLPSCVLETFPKVRFWVQVSSRSTRSLGLQPIALN